MSFYFNRFFLIPLFWAVVIAGGQTAFGQTQHSKKDILTISHDALKAALPLRATLPLRDRTYGLNSEMARTNDEQRVALSRFLCVFFSSQYC